MSPSSSAQGASSPAQADARPLAGRRVLITGGVKRIGKGIALALARAGADIAITYRRSPEEARETVAEIAASGVRAEAFLCDLHESASIRYAVPAATAWLGGMDLLVNNAGAFATASLDTIDAETWDAMFGINTRAPMLVAQAALPSLRASQTTGRIINMGSHGGLHPWVTHAHYCASKAALHMLTKTMAKAWAPQIAVNCIAPGMIVTGNEASEGYRHFVEKTPMQRNGRVEDVADLALYLAAATPFLTGQIISVDGGLGL